MSVQKPAPAKTQADLIERLREFTAPTFGEDDAEIAGRAADEIEAQQAEIARLNSEHQIYTQPAASDWQPVIGQEVRCTEALLERFPEWRGERLWVLGVCQYQNRPYPRRGLDVTVVNEWPITSRSDGGTDGFIIHGDGPDELEPVERLPSGGDKDAEIARLRAALEPFALLSIEGVVKPDETGHVKIVTVGDFFHRARAALSAQPAEQEQKA